MKMLQAIILCFLTLSFHTVAKEPEIRKLKGVTKAVNSIMQIFAEGEYMLIMPTQWQTGSGVVKGKHRDITGKELAMQTQAVTIYGWLAIPELVDWVDHEDPAVRYIAASALIIITKEEPMFRFNVEGALQGDEKWLINAKKIWRTWTPQKKQTNKANKSQPPNR